MVDFEKDMEPCLRVLHQGGLILYPTDTVWGIGCDASNEAAATIAIEEVVVVTGEAEEIPAVNANANTATEA